MWRQDLRSIFRRLVFSRFEARLFDDHRRNRVYEKFTFHSEVTPGGRPVRVEREAKNAKIRKTGSKMESLILAQDECWRRA